MTNIPAFPHVVSNSSDDVYHGLTKREYIAIMAMQAMLSGSNTFDYANNREDICGDIASASIRMADELLKQL